MVGVTGHSDVFVDYGDYFVELIIAPDDEDTVDKFIEDFDYIDQLEEGEDSYEYKNNLKEITFRYTERNS